MQQESNPDRMFVMARHKGRHRHAYATNKFYMRTQLHAYSEVLCKRCIMHSLYALLTVLLLCVCCKA